MPRDRRVRELAALVELSAEAGGLGAGITTPQYRADIVRLFSPRRWAGFGAFEVGSNNGGITRILGLLFSYVLAAELHHTSSWNQAKFGTATANVIHLTIDTTRAYALSGLVANRNVRAAVIDGAHDRTSVFMDTFNVLFDIPCCVSVIVFHDYCDQVVHDAIQLFVRESILRYRQPIGENPGTFWWCAEGRPEGAAFDVLRTKDFRHRLGALYQDFKGMSKRGDQAVLGEYFYGTSWWLPSVAAALSLNAPPAVSVVQHINPGRLGLEGEGVSVGVFKVLGECVAEPRWGFMSTFAELHDPADPGRACAELVFDPQATGFSMKLVGKKHREVCDWFFRIQGDPNPLIVGIAMSVARDLVHDVHERSSLTQDVSEAIRRGAELAV